MSTRISPSPIPSFLKNKRSKSEKISHSLFAIAPLKFDFQSRLKRRSTVKEMKRVVESERRGVNFGGCGSYSINDCLVQREFEDEFREPCNENTTNEVDAGLCILMYPSRQTANDFWTLNTILIHRCNLFSFRPLLFSCEKFFSEKFERREETNWTVGYLSMIMGRLTRISMRS